MGSVRPGSRRLARGGCDFIEEHVKGSLVDSGGGLSLGSVRVVVRYARQREAIVLLDLVPEETILLDLDLLELDDALVRETHERRSEVIDVRASTTMKGAENRRMVGGGNVTEVLVIEHGGVVTTVVSPDEDDGDYREHHRRHGHDDADDLNYPCLLALCVGLVRPLLLLRENRGKLAARGDLAVGDPRGREGDARLGVLVGSDARYGVDDVVAVECHRRVERTVTPGAHVLLRGDGLSRGDGKRHGAGDVLGLHVPAVRHELPVELAGIIPTGHDARGAIRDHELG